MARVFGYARPTTTEPDPKRLADGLLREGAEILFVESQPVQARRGLRARRRLLDQLAPGDRLILPGLDQLGTTFEDLIQTLEMVIQRGVRLQVLDAQFETGGKADKAYRDLLSLLLGARSALRSETIKVNLAAARAKGGKPAGKEPTLKPEQWPEIKARIDATSSLEVVAQEYGVHRQTLWKYRRRMTDAENRAV